MILSPVYAITDPHLLPGEVLFSSVEEALKAGVKTVQLRDKAANKADLLIKAERMLALCKRYQAQLIINDQPDLAAEIGADGVHLGRSDGSLQHARKRLGKHAIIGATCHDNINWARAAADAGADYVAFGRFYSSTTKPDASTASIDLLHQARNTIALPIVAIGGVTSDNAGNLFRAGADSVAVCAGIFAAADISTAVQQIYNVAAQQALQR